MDGFWQYNGPGAVQQGLNVAPPVPPVRTPTLPQTPEAMAEVAKVTRAARVAQFGEAAVAAMEKAGSTFGGTAPAAATTMAPITAAQRAVPTFISGLGAVKTAAGAVAPLIAPAVETGRVVDSALDPAQSAGETGIRTVMGAGRLAGAALGARIPGPWWAKAAAATAGYVAPDVANAAARQFGFGTPEAAAAPAPAQPAAPATGFGAAPAPAAPATGFQAQVRAVDNRIAGDTTPVSAPVTALDSAGIDAALAGGPQPIRGTGAIRNNRTGAVTTIDSRDTGGSGTVIDNDTGKVVADGSIGSYVGAVMNLRQAGQTEARKALAARYALEYAGKGATAVKETAAAQNEAFRTNAAAAHLAANPGDFAGASSIASGRIQPQDKFGAIPSTTGNDLITYDKSGKHPAQIQTPTRYATEANLNADMTAQKLTRAQVIARYKAQGLDVSKIKP